jgi:hypothetical protein
LEGDGEDRFRKKKGRITRRNKGIWEERSLVGSFFFIKQKPPNLLELKICIGGGFWRVYMISSNLIYVIIF